MSNQHNLPLLISVVVLVFLMVLVGVSSALTLTSTREDAFRIEATNVLKASKDATRKLEDEKIKLLIQEISMLKESVNKNGKKD